MLSSEAAVVSIAELQALHRDMRQPAGLERVSSASLSSRCSRNPRAGDKPRYVGEP